MSWDGIRDERILTKEQLDALRQLASQRACMDERNVLQILDHIEALHHIMGYCAGLLHDERTGMTVDDRAWSTVAACEVLLREHTEDPQPADTAVSGYYLCTDEDIQSDARDDAQQDQLERDGLARCLVCGEVMPEEKLLSFCFMCVPCYHGHEAQS